MRYINVSQANNTPPATEIMTNSTATKSSPATIHMMMGGPGAGKSWTIGRLFSHLEVLDMDALKQAHPDYDPKNPQDLHAWSRTEATREFFRYLGRETATDFVYDGTGTNVERYVSWINAAHDAGYQVEMVYVTCDLATALHRNANRDRVVPEDVVRAKHATVGTAFEILSRYADSVRVVNNN